MEFPPNPQARFESPSKTFGSGPKRGKSPQAPVPSVFQALRSSARMAESTSPDLERRRHRRRLFGASPETTNPDPERNGGYAPRFGARQAAECTKSAPVVLHAAVGSSATWGNAGRTLPRSPQTRPHPSIRCTTEGRMHQIGACGLGRCFKSAPVVLGTFRIGGCDLGGCSESRLEVSGAPIGICNLGMVLWLGLAASRAFRI